MLTEFADLFEGRHDAYGTEEGGCWRPTDEGWLRVANLHLIGERPIGVYPLVYARHPSGEPINGEAPWHVKWGCVDFDIAAPGKRAYDFETESDAHVAACNLRNVLARVKIAGWIEVTKSGGRHVWVFAEDWVPAATMRRALIVACQVAGAPTREVNPKSEGFDDPMVLGNYVRLPYPGALGHTSENRFMVQPTTLTEYPFDEFVKLAIGSRCTLLDLENLAQYYAPPPPPKQIEHVPEYQGGLGHLLHRIGKPARAVFYEGPMDGDRSEGLLYLAGECARGGLTPSEALVVVTDADARWGKFSNRRDGERQLQRTVERAYQ